jgi:hypothetical protein
MALTAGLRGQFREGRFMSEEPAHHRGADLSELCGLALTSLLQCSGGSGRLAACQLACQLSGALVGVQGKGYVLCSGVKSGECCAQLVFDDCPRVEASPRVTIQQVDEQAVERSEPINAG